MNDLDSCMAVYNQFVAKNKSEESYFPRAKSTFINLSNIQSILNPANKIRVGQIQNILIGQSIVQIWDFYHCELSKKSKEIHVLVLSVLVVDEIKLGKCDILTNALMVELFKKGVQKIEKHQLIDERGEAPADHAFLAIETKNGLLALDPFFKIMCPYSQYPTHPEIISYFEARSGIKPWQVKGCKHLKIEYTLPIYKKYLQIFDTQINAAKNELDAKAIKKLEQIKQGLDFVTSLSEENFDAHSGEILRRIKLLTMSRPHISLVGSDAMMVNSNPFSAQRMIPEKRMLLDSSWLVFSNMKGLTSLGLSWKTTIPSQGKLAGHEIRYLNFPKDKADMAELFNQLLLSSQFDSKVLETQKNALPSVTVDVTESQ